MDCKFRAQLVEGPISQTLAAAQEQHTLHNYSPTTSLSCADKICPRRITAFRAQATKGRGVLHTRKPL